MEEKVYTGAARLRGTRPVVVVALAVVLRVAGSAAASGSVSDALGEAKFQVA